MDKRSNGKKQEDRKIAVDIQAALAEIQQRREFLSRGDIFTLPSFAALKTPSQVDKNEFES
jgi:hypothetical protein